MTIWIKRWSRTERYCRIALQQITYNHKDLREIFDIIVTIRTWLHCDSCYYKSCNHKFHRDGKMQAGEMTTMVKPAELRQNVISVSVYIWIHPYHPPIHPSIHQHTHVISWVHVVSSKWLILLVRIKHRNSISIKPRNRKKNRWGWCIGLAFHIHERTQLNWIPSCLYRVQH